MGAAAGAAVVGWAVHQLYQTRWDALAVAAMIASVCVNLVAADLQVWIVERTTGARPLRIMMFTREICHLMAHWLTGPTVAALVVLAFVIVPMVYVFYRTELERRGGLLRPHRHRQPRPPPSPLAQSNDPQERDADNDSVGRPRWQLMAMGVGTHHFQMTGASHTMAQRNKCCICDKDSNQTIRCNNIADYVCMNCVILWAVRSAGTNGNNWPCCRG